MIVSDVTAYANTLNKYATVMTDILSGDNEAITFRGLGSDPAVKVYLGGLMYGELNVSVMCASKDMVTCKNQLDYYKGIFLGKWVNLSGTVKVKCDVISDAQLIHVDQNDRYVYEMRIRIKYYERNGGE